MPTICRFFGIIIEMFYNDHNPPHFHARYGEYKSIIDINTLEEIEGDLPKRQLRLVQNWADIYKYELLENWELCRSEKEPNKIEAL